MGYNTFFVSFAHDLGTTPELRTISLSLGQISWKPDLLRGEKNAATIADSLWDFL